MTASAKLNELNLAENPARELLERLGWTYVPRETLAAERDDERDVLLHGRLTAALMRLNEWMTEDQAQRVIFNLQHIDATGLARNQAVQEYFSLGMPLTVDRGGRQETPTVRFSTSTTRSPASAQGLATASPSPRSQLSPQGRSSHLSADSRLPARDLSCP